MQLILVHRRHSSLYPEPVDDQAAAISQTAAALLLIFVIIVIVAGAIACLVLLRNHYRRQLPRKPAQPRPVPPDAWAESARRLTTDPDADNPDDNPDENHDDDDDDDGDDQPTEPVPSAPSMSASC